MLEARSLCKRFYLCQSLCLAEIIRIGAASTPERPRGRGRQFGDANFNWKWRESREALFMSHCELPSLQSLALRLGESVLREADAAALMWT